MKEKAKWLLIGLLIAVASCAGKPTSKAGFIDRTGKVVIELRFDAVRPFSEGLACVKVDDHWGYIDKTGRFVVAPVFSIAGDFSNGLARVEIGGRWVGKSRYDREYHRGKWAFIDKGVPFILRTFMLPAAGGSIRSRTHPIVLTGHECAS